MAELGRNKLNWWQVSYFIVQVLLQGVWQVDQVINIILSIDMFVCLFVSNALELTIASFSFLHPSISPQCRSRPHGKESTCPSMISSIQCRSRSIKFSAIFHCLHLCQYWSLISWSSWRFFPINDTYWYWGLGTFLVIDFLRIIKTMISVANNYKICSIQAVSFGLWP